MSSTSRSSPGRTNARGVFRPTYWLPECTRKLAVLENVCRLTSWIVTCAWTEAGRAGWTASKASSTVCSPVASVTPDNEWVRR